MIQHFTRTKEDFVCEHCGTEVVGDGYTNHCPVCLWSKHVDVHPGDRASLCGGMMRPHELIVSGGQQTILHVCERCGHHKRNKTSDDDDTDALIYLSAHPRNVI